MKTTGSRMLGVVFVTGFILASITLYHFAARHRAEFLAMLWLDYAWWALTWLSIAARLVWKGPYKTASAARPAERSCLDEFVL